MKKNICTAILLSFIVFSCASAQHYVGVPSFSFKVSRDNTKKKKKRTFAPIKTIGVCIGENADVEKMAKVMKYDLEFTDQLTFAIKRSAAHLSEEKLDKLFKKKDISLCVQLSPKQVKKKKNLFWTVKLPGVEAVVKDTASKSTVFKKTFTYSKKNLIHDAHKIAEELIVKLTGNKPVCLSSLAYCKQLSPQQKVICVADYAGFKEKMLIPHEKLNVAPCWHSSAPYLFYSQFTTSNVRLMSYNLSNKKQQIICSYDGMNMQPSFSEDGSKVILCMTGKHGNSELFLFDQKVCDRLGKKVYTPITNNRGSNSSPCLLPNDDVVFCSDFQTGNPQLYYYKKETRETMRISTGSAYCAAPSYNACKNALVYTRPVRGVFQLFSLSFTQDGIKEKQLTFGRGDKVDPSWSDCGRYIAFTYDYLNRKTKRKIPQIAVFNTMSGKIRVITHDNKPKSFPAWTSSSYYRL